MKNLFFVAACGVFFLFVFSVLYVDNSAPKPAVDSMEELPTAEQIEDVEFSIADLESEIRLMRSQYNEDGILDDREIDQIIWRSQQLVELRAALGDMRDKLAGRPVAELN